METVYGPMSYWVSSSWFPVLLLVEWTLVGMRHNPSTALMRMARYKMELIRWLGEVQHVDHFRPCKIQGIMFMALRGCYHKLNVLHAAHRFVQVQICFNHFAYRWWHTRLKCKPFDFQKLARKKSYEFNRNFICHLHTNQQHNNGDDFLFVVLIRK